MKQSWVVGCVILYVIMQGLTMVVQQDSLGTTGVWSTMQGIWHLNYQQLVGSSTSAIWATAATVITAFKTLGQIVTGYYPALFTGYYLWFWWVIIFAIDAGMVISIATIIRGVHTS